MKSVHLHSILIMMCVLWIQCTSPAALIEEGKYDDAIELALDKIKGKKNKNPKHVQALERAFAKANESDLQQVKDLELDNQESKWEKIYAIQQGIQRRQNRIKPLLPLYDKKGYEAGFVMIDVADDIAHSKSRTSEYLYAQAQELLEQSQQTGDKSLAREAHEALLKLDKISPDYKDKNVLMDQAKASGTNHVLLQILNESGVLMHREVHNAITSLSQEGIHSSWIEYHTDDDDNPYDGEIVIRLTRIDVSPERTSSREYSSSSEIEDGEDYVLDANGNVAKDSLGNDITEPRIVEVTATIIETQQIKEAFIEGQLEFWKGDRQQLLKQENISSEIIFENYYSRYQGDERALSQEDRQYLQNGPATYPTDEGLILDAAEALKPEIKRYIKRHEQLML